MALILTDKQKEFIRNGNKRYNIKTGATRSGKTFLDILYTIPLRLRQRVGLEGLNVILGVSKETIERNVLTPLRDKYGTDLVSTINSRNIATLFGEQVYCLGAEKVSQVSKIRGSSIKYCYCDELAEYNQEVFELLKSRLDREYSCLDATLNPSDTNHWLKKDFIDVANEKGIDLYLQEYTIFDNPLLPETFVKNLCKEYEGTVYYNRYILGQWCNAEGIIFKTIAENKERYLTDKISDGIICIGIDWGGNSSKHSITATKIKRDYSGIQVIKSSLLNATGTGTKELFRWIINFIIEVQDKYGRISTIFCDSAEQVLINSLRSELEKKNISIPIANSIKTEIKDRIQAIIRLLNLDKISFVINETDTVVEALQTALYDETVPEDRWIDDGQTSDIDSLDSFCYSWEKWTLAIMRRIGGSL